MRKVILAYAGKIPIYFGDEANEKERYISVRIHINSGEEWDAKKDREESVLVTLHRGGVQIIMQEDIVKNISETKGGIMRKEGMKRSITANPDPTYREAGGELSKRAWQRSENDWQRNRRRGV